MGEIAARPSKYTLSWLDDEGCKDGPRIECRRCSSQCLSYWHRDEHALPGFVEDWQVFPDQRHRFIYTIDWQARTCDVRDTPLLCDLFTSGPDKSPVNQASLDVEEDHRQDFEPIAILGIRRQERSNRGARLQELR